MPFTFLHNGTVIEWIQRTDEGILFREPLTGNHVMVPMRDFTEANGWVAQYHAIGHDLLPFEIIQAEDPLDPILDTES